MFNNPDLRRGVGLLLLAAALLLAGMPGLLRPPVTRAAVAAEPELEHPDHACRTCHQAIYDAYEKTPMALGSGAALDGLDAHELRAHGFTSPASGIRYAVEVQDGSPLLRYRSDKEPELQGEQRLRYFIGSGHRGRTFLFERDGLWFEIPINWYGKKQVWDMAPAFESSPSLPPPLPTDSNCLHCHAGEVQTATGGARNHFAAVPFRAGGVGCASCHGDPAAHLDAVTHGRPAAGTILNPDSLSPYRRDSVCLQCHLEGDATVFRPNRSLAMFRPGEDLSADAVYFVDRNRAQEGLRASSQYEALLRSACKRGAGDRLTCTTCHDPHSSLSSAPQAERVAFFRGKCLQCHSSPEIARRHHPEQPDCAACHMPTRQTLDISHEQLTDHDIEARPSPTASAAAVLHSKLVAPELVPVGPVRVTLREEGLAYAQLAQAGGGSRAAGERALQLLLAAKRGGGDDAELHNQLGFLLQRAGNRAEAAAEYRAALALEPEDNTAAANLAVIDAAAGHVDESLTLLSGVVARDGSQTAAGLNLAFLQCRLGHREDARVTVRAMLRFNPGSAAARTFLKTGEFGGQSCPLSP